jgi:hypothetical protein
MRTKILLFFGILFCIGPALNAQVSKDRLLIGGSFSIYSEKNDQPLPVFKNEYFNTNIQFGKVVKDNTVVGVTMSYNHSTNNYATNSQVNKSNQYSAGVFYRKYKKLVKEFYFFAEVDAIYSHSNTQEYSQNPGDISKTTMNGGSVSFIPGISYALCKRMQVELLMPNIISLSYSHTKIDYTNSTPPSPPTEKGNVFDFNTNLNSNLLSSLGIGFKLLLGK